MSLLKNWLKIKENAKLKLDSGIVEKSVESLISHFNCQICQSALINPMQTSCGHVYCSICLNNMTTRNDRKCCAVCKKKFLSNDFTKRDDVAEAMSFAIKVKDKFQLELKHFTERGVSTEKKLMTTNNRVTNNYIIVTASVIPEPQGLPPKGYYEYKFTTSTKFFNALDQHKDKLFVITEAETSSASRTNNRCYLLCPCKLDKAQIEKLHEFCKICNGSVSNELTSKVTHLVINRSYGKLAKMFNYLLAIAGKKWIVIFDWVEKSIENTKLLPEAKFEICNFKEGDPGVQRARLTSRNLFEGFDFYFSSRLAISDQYGFTINEVKHLMATLGANVVGSLKTFNKPRLFIIGSLNENDTEYYNWFNTRKWITIIFQYIIDCILEYRVLPIQKKYLCIAVSEQDYKRIVEMNNSDVYS